ncbi:MAG: hypothetical protein CMH56_12575 [Myxococcales bacterium]|nr:hypothetical protein [Myxococcales bacterium]|tara:strand:+ start:741 stop:2957 length:2217 start_codon:yes stop_codon:yes gene_type:complete
MPLTTTKSLVVVACCLLFAGCQEDTIKPLAAPILLVNSPLHFGDVAVGSSQTGKLVVTNGGDAPLTIDTVRLEPFNGIFQVGMKSETLTINGRRSVELVIIFTPLTEGPQRAELTFESNHQGDALSPVVLLGNGISDVVCLPCSPPPASECHTTGDVSISYVETASTSCESESGACAYQAVETPCSWGPCEPETGLCPEEPEPEPDPVCGDGEVTGAEECDDGNTETEICAYGEGACEICDALCALVPGQIQFCGDNAIQEDEEECDNGTDNNSDTLPDACRSNCFLPHCGDSVIDTDETCDDGNAFDGDGCDSDCLQEDGWDCLEGPCEPICGDGEVVGDEACDDGNTTTEYCPYGATYCVVCGSDCQFEPGLLQSCGDGIVQEGETCDDGDNNNDYAPNACRSNCQVAGCGDGIIDTGEACDDQNIEDEDGCSSACIVEAGWLCVGQPSQCESICGDAIVVGDEACDDGNNEIDLCPYSVMSCVVCDNNCQETGGLLQYCGDGVFQEDHEECDEGVEGLQDDNPFSFNSDTEKNACRGNCLKPFCGDGVIDTGELCDDRNGMNGDGCSELCVVEPGWECVDEPSICDRVQVGAPGEICTEAEPILTPTGTTTATFGYQNNFNLGPLNFCTEWASDGYEVFYSVELQPNQEFKAKVLTGPNFDPSIYILDSCLPNARCMVGADENYPAPGFPPSETLSFTWYGTYTQTFYLVIDAYCMGEFQCPNQGDNFTLSWTIE